MPFWEINTTTSKCFNEGTFVSLAGRVVSFRRQGGIAFGHIYDGEGKIQFCFQKRIIGQELFKSWSDKIKLGCHIGIAGNLWKSSTGEMTILVGAHLDGDSTKDGCFRLLQNVWRSFPDKVNGIVGAEQKLRKRYLDCILNDKVRNTFKFRSRFIKLLRHILEEEFEMSEVETPILSAQASGAQAKPFLTHHNALGADLYMRIAPETYLKRAVACGFSRVFEIGKQFRNEGIDPSHLQEFTSLEWYAAYLDYLDNLELFRKLLSTLANHFTNSSEFETGIANKLREWSVAPVISYRELFRKHTGQNPDELSSRDADFVFKTKVRPQLSGSVFVIDYPAHMSPMAARKTTDENTVEQWQFIVDGWEIVKCYTELTNPITQRVLLEAQMKAKQNGDDEAMSLEEDFLECMEYGMPPMSGLGMGIDRIICLLCDCESLRDVVLFPTLLARN